MVTKAELHQLIDALPEEAVPEAGRLLNGLHKAGQHELPAKGRKRRARSFDSLAWLVQNARDLGPDVLSEDPHGFAGRRWFENE